MKRINVLSLIVISIILTPWIEISGNLPQLRPEWLIVLVGLAAFPVSTAAARSRVFVWGVIVIALYVMSMILGALFLDTNICERDLFTVISPGLFLLFFVVAASGTYSLSQHLSFIRVTLFALGVSAVITVIQFFNPNIVAPIVTLWTDGQLILAYKLSRATGTMGNPNDQGFLMICGFSLALFIARHAVMPFVLRWGLVILFLGAVFTTGSRTAMVCVVAVVGSFLVLDLGVSLKTLIIGTIIIAVPYWVFNNIISESFLLKGLLERIDSFQNLDLDIAWQARVNGTLEMLPIISDSPLFGHGPDKIGFAIGSNIDNEFILILYRFGLLGLIGTVGFVWTLAMQLSKLQATRSPIFISMRHFAIASAAASALFAYTAGIFMSFRLLGLLIMIWTVSARVVIAPNNDFAPDYAPKFSTLTDLRNCHPVNWHGNV